MKTAHPTNANINRKNIFGLFAVLAIGLLLSACSSGGSGGSDSGAGSSVVSGNVSSVGYAMALPVEKTSSSVASFFTSLFSVNSANADAGVSGIAVNISGMQTQTDASGYFSLAGVAPGSHQVLFAKNGITSTMSVDVGVNDYVTMQNVNIRGQRSSAQSISHQSMATNQGAQTNAGNQGNTNNQYGYNTNHNNQGIPDNQNNNNNQGIPDNQNDDNNHNNQGTPRA